MNFLSKDAPLKTTLEHMRDTLSGISLNFSQPKHPLKHCHSINLAYTLAPSLIYSNGKGITKDAAIASAMGEFIERLQSNLFFSDFYIPDMKHFSDEAVLDFSELDEKIFEFYDKNSELSFEDFIDFNSDYEDKIVTLPFKKIGTNELLYLPINILQNLYMSNGMASGNTPYEAKVQALCEIFERYVKFEVIKNGYSLPKLDITSFAKVSEDIATLESLGYKLSAYDATLGGVFPVVAISLINPSNATLFVSFGSHPNLEVALERTLSELMQGRDIQNLDSFATPSFDMEFVSDSINLESHFIDSNGVVGFGFLKSREDFEFCEWSFAKKDTKTQYEQLLILLNKLDKSAYIREYEYLGFYTAHIVVPTMSEIYTLDDLVLNNKNRGKFLRDMVLNFASYEPHDLLYELDLLDDNLDIAKYIGVVFSSDIRAYHLKAQANLALKNYDEVLYLLSSSKTMLDCAVCELIRAKQMGVNIKEYEFALELVFTTDIISKATKVLEANELLFDTTFHKDYINILALYESLELGKHAI